MLTYRIRPRAFRHADGSVLSWPADCSLRFHLKPEQPFGTAPGGGRTITLAERARINFNANTGRHEAISERPLSPLAVSVKELGRTFELKGNVLTISERFESAAETEVAIESIVYGLTALLNVDFADPPCVERVDGAVGGVPFVWELAGWQFETCTTTQEKQQQAVGTAWRRLAILPRPGGRRVFAALSYFHTAVRLERASGTLGEFMAEAILNLAKTLEVLFPPAGDVQTREAIRAGLRLIGYEDASIEKLFLPAIALRNQIDVGHVSLALLTSSQLKAIRTYTEHAEPAFRGLLSRVLDAIEQGRLSIPEYDDAGPSKGAQDVIQRLADAFALDSDG